MSHTSLALSQGENSSSVLERRRWAQRGRGAGQGHTARGTELGPGARALQCGLSRCLSRSVQAVTSEFIQLLLFCAFPMCWVSHG